MSDRVKQLEEIHKNALELFKKKNTDYGDAFAKYGIVGILTRIEDKMSRCINISKNKVKLIDESYNSNPLSLKFSIEKFSSMDSNNQKKIVLLGDMLELGKFSKRLHMEVPKIINKSDIDKVYVFGNFMKQAFNKIKTQKQGKIFETKKEINDFINTEIKENVHLMIKGSNSTGLNKIIKKYI